MLSLISILIDHDIFFFSSSLPLDNEERVRLFAAMENITCRLCRASRAPHHERSLEYTVTSFRANRKKAAIFDLTLFFKNVAIQ
jgi:hypothetical protein